MEIGAYEIVTPVRVSESGDEFPTSVHFKRKRRSLSEGSGTGNGTDNWASPNTHYRISAFGRHYHLNLTMDSGFIAPLYTVTVLGEPRGDNGTFVATDGEEEEEEKEKEEDTELRHCFYKGLVNARAEHAAVISLCSGLLGTFRSPEGEFFVEPLHSYRGERYEEEHTKPHVVYRKRAAERRAAAAEEEDSACDTSGTMQAIRLARTGCDSTRCKALACKHKHVCRG
ncbi:A disintegrin and metalloproteinase with thrombospondin motifs 9 [Liparis tanakae]|uniref:A disintegrin and metalloproteinase with thrombospondin motifs 9 n=1 Tax=Liparis tanakae TaxID=230148 RepID=A0A4Z2ESI4_9TELE|nr:A disintegrin and metalloproteinase with thrombospondin motifs 9 [Liparis tanakae]